jgi:hypothetical protein
MNLPHITPHITPHATAHITADIAGDSEAGPQPLLNGSSR